MFNKFSSNLAICCRYFYNDFSPYKITLFFSSQKLLNSVRLLSSLLFFFFSIAKQIINSRYSFLYYWAKVTKIVHERRKGFGSHTQIHTCQSCATFSQSTLVVRRKHCLDDRHYHYSELKKATSNELRASGWEAACARILCVAQQTHVHLRIKMLSETIRFFLRFFIALIFVGRCVWVWPFVNASSALEPSGWERVSCFVIVIF